MGLRRDSYVAVGLSRRALRATKMALGGVRRIRENSRLTACEVGDV